FEPKQSPQPRDKQESKTSIGPWRPREPPIFQFHPRPRGHGCLSTCAHNSQSTKVEDKAPASKAALDFRLCNPPKCLPIQLFASEPRSPIASESRKHVTCWNAGDSSRV